MVNLTLNARDAMPDGGIIVITAENVVLSRSDTPANIEGDYVALRITDTGMGIAPDVLPRIFDPFFTTKGVDRGSGLGLSQVHGFAHQSGGTVTVDSVLGHGTTVTIYLPRAHGSIDERPAEPETDSASGGTVLLVEDNPEVAEVTAVMLQQLGYDVCTVTEAKAALDAVDRQSFDLVITDIVMPGAMNGVALAHTIRERKPELPVLLVTGYSQTAAEAAASFTVMRKPFELADLSRVAAGMIAAAKQPPTSNLVRLRDARRSASARADEK